MTNIHVINDNTGREGRGGKKTIETETNERVRATKKKGQVIVKVSSRSVFELSFFKTIRLLETRSTDIASVLSICILFY